MAREPRSRSTSIMWIIHNCCGMGNAYHPRPHAKRHPLDKLEIFGCDVCKTCMRVEESPTEVRIRTKKALDCEYNPGFEAVFGGISILLPFFSIDSSRCVNHS